MKEPLMARRFFLRDAAQKIDTEDLVEGQPAAFAPCRTFEQGAVGGIACTTGDDWRLARVYGGVETRSTEFRQAGSASAAMMADAQTMMAGEPLDAAGEAAALAGR